MQAVFMEQDGENAKSNNHYTWLNRLCESMKLSIGEVATLFDENENLRKQIDSLQHGNEHLNDIASWGQR